MRPDGVTIIMPAYNEAENIAAAAAAAAAACRMVGVDCEIIIVNDGSRDGTDRVATSLARRKKNIRVIQYDTNRGFGYALRQGLSVARMPYVGIFPSDNEMAAESFADSVANRRSADFISTYMANPEARPLVRRLVSGVFVIILNVLFGLRLRYYTGPFIAKTHLLQDVLLASDGASILAEMRVRLFASGATFREIPFTFRMRKHGKATLFRWITVWQTLLTLLVLLRDRLSERL